MEKEERMVIMPLETLNRILEALRRWGSDTVIEKEILAKAKEIVKQ
jgi:hypothetical protein